MKRLWLLFVMLFLAACGSGGGGTTSSSGGAPGTAGTNGTGSVSLKFVTGTKQDAAKVVASSIPDAEPGRVRVLFTSPAYKTVVDFPFGASDTTVSLPIGTYKVEALWYENSTIRRLSHYGKSPKDIGIAEGANTSSVITMGEIKDSVALNLPGSPVYSGGLYTVAPAAADLESLGLAKQWSLAVKMTTDPDTVNPFAGPVHLAQNPSELHLNIPAPYTQKAGKLYFQGEFFMRADFLKEGESATNWAFYVEPSPIELKVSTLGGVVPTDPTFVDNTAPQVTFFSVPALKQGTTTISPINIGATDNAGIAYYMITESATPPTDDPASNTSRWLTDAPTKYQYAGSLAPDGSDTPVTLYAWVRDYAGHVSAPFPKRTAIINTSPVATKFTVPSTTLFNKNVEMTFNGKSYTGAALEFAITETPLQPLPSAFKPWPTPDPITTDVKATYPVTSINQQEGVKYNVPLFLWVKTGSSISASSLQNHVTICDIPQITSFKVWTPVPNGKVVSITELKGTAADGGALTFKVTETNTSPAATDINESSPTSYTFTSAVTAGEIKTLYAWAKDSKDRISLPKAVYVRFSAP